VAEFQDLSRNFLDSLRERAKYVSHNIRCFRSIFERGGSRITSQLSLSSLQLHRAFCSLIN